MSFASCWPDCVLFTLQKPLRLYFEAKPVVSAISRDFIRRHWNHSREWMIEPCSQFVSLLFGSGRNLDDVTCEGELSPGFSFNTHTALKCRIGPYLLMDSLHLLNNDLKGPNWFVRKTTCTVGIWYLNITSHKWMFNQCFLYKSICSCSLETEEAVGRTLRLLNNQF